MFIRCQMFVVVALVVVGRIGGEAEAADRPNIIVIMADDIGAKELGCYGHSTFRTPVLNKLAKTGVKFETCFTPPVCHPTRFTIMTGQYGHHHGVYNFPNKRGGPEVPGEASDKITNHVTFGQLFQKAGYKTGLAGYVNITDSKIAEAQAARDYFDKLIAKHPVPYVAFEGPPNGATTAEEQAAKDAKKKPKVKKRAKKGK